MDDSAVLFHVRDAPTTASDAATLSLARSLSDPIGFVVSVSISEAAVVTPIATLQWSRYNSLRRMSVPI